MKRRALVLLALLAVAAGIVYYFMTRTEKEITLTGIVTTDDVIVSAQIPGRLEKLLVNQGDVVKAGDPLAVIQPAQWQADVRFYESSQQQAATQVSQSEAELQWQELQSQNQILQAEANLAAAKSQVKQAEAELENLHLTYIRLEDLFKKKVESQQAYDQARTAYDAGKAHLVALQDNVRASEAALAIARNTQQQVAIRRAQVEMSKHQLQAAGAQSEKAKVQLDYTRLVAPIDGIVDVRASLAGEVVNPGQAIVTLINPDDLWIRADVEETYIDRIRLGDKMTVRLPSGATREGTVFYRAVDADFATQRDVSRTKRDIRTFEIRLRCDNTDRSLAIGMTAYVSLPLETPSTRSAAEK
jgi:multidrug resistance efflux pump